MNNIKINNSEQIKQLKRKRQIFNLNEKNFSKFEQNFLDNFINKIENMKCKEIFDKIVELNLNDNLYLINKNHITLLDYANEVY